jgi:hypothetical protein
MPYTSNSVGTNLFFGGIFYSRTAVG